MRESVGINDEGRLVFRKRKSYRIFEPFVDHPDPDLLSYDYEIRHKYLNNPEEVEADTEFRSLKDSYDRLGYPLPGRPAYLVHSFEQKFGEDFININETLNLMLLKLAPSVVSLCSFIDDKRLFTCSGIVIESTNGCAVILTSASLVATTNGESARAVSENVKIFVHFTDGPAYEASVIGCCLHYNVAFVRVHKHHKDVLSLLCLQGERMESMPEAVFALGRHYVSQEFMVASGESVFQRNNFDCVELMFSSCKITKCGIGGPLVNSKGYVVGVNFFNTDDTPYLPSLLVRRCWDHIKTYGSVVHLHFGWRIRPVIQMNAELLYNLCESFEFAFDCLLVEEVASSSPAYRSGIRNGDIAVELFGEPAVATPVPTYAEILLEKSNLLLEKENVQVQVKILRKSTHSQIDSKYLTIDATKLSSRDFYRWPLPQAEWEIKPSD
ncbi:uncharacterized protein [Spinacia oleracea]|uniref:Uncharacterized protein isoform X1 n=1 Tax=Spinacia oleracea TaxID=3562 RepID=A0A9R0HU91_SPIOL|nr:uncharacterized protein LOC110776873 isoform X1 [Spinacia oleracea]